MQESAEFERVYVLYYSKMKRFAKEYVIVDEDAENIVQDIFSDLWEKWDVHTQHNNLLGFMFLSVKNRCIDFLRHKIVEQKATDSYLEEYQLSIKLNYQALESFNMDGYNAEEIDRIVRDAIDTLPVRCKEIFIKNKFEGKKQKEIAEELNITVNTVESQMAIAYKKLKDGLKNYLPLLHFIFL